MLVKWRNLLGKLDPGYATVGQPRSFLGIPFRVDTMRGPWLSLGIHLDFQWPLIDIHFLWLVITLGKTWEYGSVVEAEGDNRWIYPELTGTSDSVYYPLTTASVNSPAMPAIEIEPRTYTMTEIKEKFFPNRDMDGEAAVSTSQPFSIMDYL